MLTDVKNGQTSVVLRVKLRDSSVATGAGLTGLTFSSSGLRIAATADNESAATAYTAAGSTIETVTTLGTYAAPTATKCRFKEVDATNHPGVYELQLADARFAVASAKGLLISISGATNLAQCDVLVPLRAVDPYDGVRGGMTALPNAAAAAAGGLFTRGTGAGQVNQDANGRIDVNVVAAAATAWNSGGITSATFTSGAINATAIAPDAIGASELATDGVQEIAGAVWDIALAGHLGGGSTGLALNSASSAGDPWNTAVPGAYGTGTAGNILGNRLDAAVTSRTDAAGVRTAVGLASANLDTQLAAIAADLPQRITKGVALSAFPFFMSLSTDHVTGAVGLVVTAQRSLDGGAFGNCTNAVSEIGSGWFKIDLSAADLNATTVALKFTAAGADGRNFTIVTEPT